MTATATDRLAAILNKLHGVVEHRKTKHAESYLALCPVHDDSTPSLAIDLTRDGHILLKCWVCGRDATKDIMRTIGEPEMILFPPDRNGHQDHSQQKIVGTWDYHGPDGNVLYQVVRKEPGKHGRKKDFVQRQPDGKGGWIWNMSGINRVLYRLPELLAAPAEQPIFVIEGERKVEALRKLGFVATCNVGGAGKWKDDFDFVEPLKGHQVIILPDNDQAGQDHAQQVKAILHKHGIPARIVELPGLKEKGDIVNWLEDGGTKEKLLELIAKPAHPEPAAEKPQTRFTLGQLLAAHPELNKPVIDWLVRERETANIISVSKIGKSWLVYGLMWNIITGGHWLGRFTTEPGRVLLIDNELHKSTLAYRLKTVAKALGINIDDHADALEVWPLRGNLKDIHQIGPELKQVSGFKAIILDAKYRMIPAGSSENDNAAETQFYNAIDHYAEITGAAFINVHHSTKGSQGEKRVTDVGSGAGAQSRAADCHIVLREHEDDDTVVLEAAVRSFPPVEPVALKWEFPLWVPVNGVDTSRLKGRLSRQEERQSNKDKEGMEIIRNFLAKQGTATMRDLRKTGISRQRLERLIGIMESRGEIGWTDERIRGNDTRKYHLRGYVGD